MEKINFEAKRILDKNKNDTIHHDSDRFFKLASELSLVNSTRSAPKINDKITDFVKYCADSRETRYKYEEIVNITQQFMNEIKL